MAEPRLDKLHALVVPAMPTGHKNACLRLARSLCAAGFNVTFVWFSSRSTLASGLQATPNPSGNAPSAQGGSCNPHENAGCSDNGVLTFHTIEDGIPAEHIDKPFFSTPVMAKNLLTLILELRGQGDCDPCCLISDSFAPWTVPVAQQAGIPRIDFWTSNALAYLLILSVPSLRSDKVFPETGEKDGAKPAWKSKSPLMLSNIPCMPAISSELFPPEIRFDNGSIPFLRLFQEMCFCATLSYRCLIYSTSELEPDAFRGMQAMGLSVRAIAGCLLHESVSENVSRVSASEDVKKNDCLVWLDKQNKSSVIYVAFGSVVDLTAADVEELAIGLEASGCAFLWALRWEGEPIEAVNGLAERTKGRGMVTGWAPQTEILSHAAIGAFLSHCGWNSVMESLWEGVPLLCCPFLGDERSNAWYLCEVWRVGLELERSSHGGLRREYVESGVKALLQTPQGSAARQKAKEIMVSLREEAKQGSESFTNLQCLYDDLKQVVFSPY